MSRKALFGNVLLLVAAGLCAPIFLAACLTIYPSIKYVAGVEVSEPRDQVRCFRAEITTVNSGYFRGTSDQALLLSEVAISPTGHVKGQVRFTVDSNRRPLIGLPETVRRTVELRLYRPGFETVRLGPKDEIEAVIWKQAADLAAQESAVDDLLHAEYHPAYSSANDKPSAISIEGILPGSTSAAHRTALLYAASEYERLAGGAQDEPRCRLVDKATRIRERAGTDETNSKPPATQP